MSPPRLPCLLAALLLLPALAAAQSGDAPVHTATHGDWQLSCFRNEVIGTVRCGLEQRRPLPERDAQHAALLIQGDRRLRILVLISSAGFAPDGAVGIRIDDNEPVAAPGSPDNFVPLDPSSSAPLIKQMKAGMEFLMSYTTADGDKVTVSFSLRGVTAGLADLERQISG